MSRLSERRWLWLALLLCAGVGGGALLWWRSGPVRSFEDLSARKQAEFLRIYGEAEQRLRRGNLEEVEAQLRRCLEIFDGDAKVYAALGRLWHGMLHAPGSQHFGEEEEDALVDRSLAAVERALAIDPRCRGALEVRWEIRKNPTLRRYDPEGALADGEEILKISPQDADFRLLQVAWLLGGVRFRRGREGEPAFDSGIGLELAERHFDWLIDNLPIGTDLYVRALHGLGMTYLFMGDFDRAAATLDLVDTSSVPEEARARSLLDLAVAEFRQDRAEKAADALTRSMKIQPTLETAWLLRLVYEALGREMGGLDPKHRFPLPEEVLGPGPAPKIRFTEVGETLGVAKVDGAGPSAFADYDGDGDPDILAAGCDTFTALYRNDRGKFTDVTIEAGLHELESGFGVNLVDYDNDGHLDIYVCRNGWSGNAPNVLLRNRGDGTFEDRSEESGLDDPACGFVSVWADFDRDGFLDVYITNGVINDGHTNRLYRNQGDGTFEDVTERAGLTETRGWETIGAAIGDYDQDGDPDIFVNGRGEAPNRLYRNRGDWTFDDVARDSGVGALPHNGYVAFFLDYNNDALPDILTTSLADWEVVLQGFTRLNVPQSPGFMDRDVSMLYRNRGDGTFVDVTFEAGLMHPHGVMGANVADLDNDGYIDLYFATGAPSFKRMEPSAFYHNNGDGTFSDLTRYAALGHLGKGHGYTFADFDLDGDLDIYAPEGGFWHGDLWANPFYRNEAGSENHWLHLKLRGVKSNRFAVGAQVTLRSGEMTQYREVEGGIGFGSTNSYPVEFGLGDLTQVDEIEILWPSGERQVLKSPPVDALLEVEESREGWRRIRPREAD